MRVRTSLLVIGSELTTATMKSAGAAGVGAARAGGAELGRGPQALRGRGQASAAARRRPGQGQGTGIHRLGI
jgi:hypothetical protein